MSWSRKIQRLFRALLQKEMLDAQMHDEMRSHIETQTQENIDAGMNREVNVISTRLAQAHPESNRNLRFNVTPLRRDIADIARRPLIVLLAAALGLLLIGCCNLVNLLLARSLTRSRENAVRSALGATQARLIRQAATEMLPILTLGSLLGARWP